MIAVLCGFKVLTARVHDGDYVYVFVFASSRIGISAMVCVFKCNSVKVLFLEFSQLKLRLWGGYLWSEGYAVVLLVRLLVLISKTISIELESNGYLLRKR
jgi:REP element-mobilizing transposase RayT